MQILLEYGGRHNLRDYLMSSKVTEEEKWYIFQSVASGIQYLHRNGIAHRDLKLDNIVVDLNETEKNKPSKVKSVKIIDFGFGTRFTAQTVLVERCGTPVYMSPELMERKPYNGPEVDIWALGVIFYRLMFGCFPFNGESASQLKKKIEGGYGSVYSDGMENPMKELLAGMFSLDRKKRLTIDQVSLD